VHYNGRLADSGSIFMDTKETGSSGQPVTVVAGRGKISSLYKIYLLFTFSHINSFFTKLNKKFLFTVSNYLD